LDLGLADADDLQQALFGGRPGLGQDDLICLAMVMATLRMPDDDGRRTRVRGISALTSPVQGPVSAMAQS
jgi:hypothetical protein